MKKSATDALRLFLAKAVSVRSSLAMPCQELRRIHHLFSFRARGRNWQVNSGETLRASYRRRKTKNLRFLAGNLARQAGWAIACLADRRRATLGHGQRLSHGAGDSFGGVAIFGLGRIGKRVADGAIEGRRFDGELVAV